ncbi:MAG: lysylphosphatidylglycerol synthase domain-containing protein [Thermomicrobiales bacterium]
MIIITMLGLLTAWMIFRPSLSISFEDISEQATDVPLHLILIVVLLKIVQTIASTLSWRNVLRAAFPDEPITFKRVFLIEQGKDGANLLLPTKVGMWGMLSALRLTIPGAQMPTIVAAWGAQSIGFMVCGLINTCIAAYLLPGTLSQRNNPVAGFLKTVTSQPLAIAGALVAAGAVIWFLARKCRHRVVGLRDQFIAGVAIVGSPTRYARFIFLPVLVSYACRYGMTIAIMSAFGIPITPATVALALASHQIAGAIRFTPGGFGTTQAIDVVTLHAFASSSTIAAYSLTQGVLMTSLTLMSGLIALLWAIDYRADRRFSFARIRANR